MSIVSIYNTFLTDPTPAVLADDNVALNYVTSATQITGAEKIIEHLIGLQNDIVKKEDQKILNIVEGYCSLSLEVKTTLEFFLGSGGPYLPDVDADNLKGKAVTFLVVHVVHFDGSNKITQIRLHWDQAALLKQLAIIPSDNNWPIKEPIEQTQLVSDSATAAAKVAPEKPVKKMVMVKKSSAPSSPSTTRTARRPAQRTPSEIFGRHPSSSGSTTPKKERPFRPDPKSYSHFEFGEGQLPQVLPRRNFREKPHFEFGEAPITKAASPKPKRTAAKDHFEFGEAPPDAIPKHRLTKSRDLEKHAPKWNFEDFNTPEKPKPRILPAHVRHFGISEEDVDDTTSTTPQNPKRVIKPRKDAETHFEIRSDGTPGPLDRPRRSVGSFQGKGRRLYETNVVTEGNEDGDSASAEKKQAGAGASASRPARHGRKDIDAHWDLDDLAKSETSEHSNGKPHEDRSRRPSHARHNKELGHHWDVNNPADGEPEPPATRSQSHVRHTEELDYHWDAVEEGLNKAQPQQQTKFISSDRAKAVKNITSSFNILTDDPMDTPVEDRSRQASVSSSTYARNIKDLHSTWDLPTDVTPVKPAAAAPAPAPAAAASGAAQQENRHSKSIRNMHSTLDDYNSQPTPVKRQVERAARKEEGPAPSRQMAPARYNQFQRHWGFGDDSEY
ncbi:hypothetical protein KEM54_002899 [Ascosphaera aggregata]|nr:hypothetical protein KEM54_002899 [Ascosphaera aggregata]